MPAYRLAFNILAVVLLAVPLHLTLTYPGPWLWRWSGFAFGIALVLSTAAVAGFLWSLKYYDGSEFLGLRQLRERNASVDEQEQFQLSPLHRWVRHPWYFFRAGHHLDARHACGDADLGDFDDAVFHHRLVARRAKTDSLPRGYLSPLPAAGAGTGAAALETPE